MQIAIASGKGGTGKTTLSVALAQAWDGPVHSVGRAGAGVGRPGSTARLRCRRAECGAFPESGKHHRTSGFCSGSCCGFFPLYRLRKVRGDLPI